MYFRSLSTSVLFKHKLYGVQQGNILILLRIFYFFYVEVRKSIWFCVCGVELECNMHGESGSRGWGYLLFNMVVWVIKREGGRERERGNKWKRWRHSAFWCALAALKSDLLSCVCVVIGDMLKCGTRFIWCVIFIFDCSQTGVSLFVLLFRTPKPFSEWIKKYNYSLSAAAVKYQTTTPHSSHSVQTSRHFHLMIYWWGICLFLVTCL